eukprot:gnl/TRDRNA2_/TRDRNA2_82680_c0_seq1.p1 gnl/TRDRNA2_/TRDRNA2_82680_c0~~gnl/TRDRNA2_/TRDRNA2_82680_c0_seq1.p1  ORF type:complete len:467 (-),score=67.59 gnl/TRDRNA2_/TRDRNA2_82680_c0_seq1:197-1597(-)
MEASSGPVVVVTVPTPRLSRRRARICSGSGDEDTHASSTHWPAKWRRLLTNFGTPPKDFTEFDRTVRGMLNRISAENATRILPLEPSLRGAMPPATGDCPPWWAVRFAALMLSSYVQVIHTNRFARGLVLRSADNVLPEYLDAVAPLLVRSPRLVTALLDWLAHLLRWHDMAWPTTRLLLLATRQEQRQRQPLVSASRPLHSQRSAGATFLPRPRVNELPLHSLGRLPPELVRVRILGFLLPPRMPVVERMLLQDPSSPSSIFRWSGDQRDVVAVLVHLIMFVPSQLWPRISAFSFALAEAALRGPSCDQDVGAAADACNPWEDRVYLAASLLATIAQRLETSAKAVVGMGAGQPAAAAGQAGQLKEEAPVAAMEALRRHVVEDMGPLARLALQMRSATAAATSEELEAPKQLSRFVGCRVQVALEQASRTQEQLQQRNLQFALLTPPAHTSGNTRPSASAGEQPP